MKKILQLITAIALLFLSVAKVNAQTIYYSEDFEATTGTAIPSTWTQSTLSTDGGWLSGTGTSLASTYFPIPAHTRFVATNDDGCDCNKSNDFLKSASFSLAAASHPVLTVDVFYSAGNGANQFAPELSTVEVSTNGGTSWVVVDTLPALNWTNYAIDLTAYAGMSNVMVGFRYNDGADWNYGLAIDNVKIIEPPVKELALTDAIVAKYALAGNQTIKTELKSFGGPVVASAIVKYSVDGGAPVQQTFSPNITYNHVFTATFTTAATISSLGVHIVKIWVDDINGTGPDANATNDTVMTQISIQATKPVKKCLVEEFTGAWCGYCPRGGVALANFTSADTNVIGAAIHDHDNMSTTEGNTVVSSFATGFPEGMIDRSSDLNNYADVNDYRNTNNYAEDDSQWGGAITARENAVVPVTVALSAITFNTTTRAISVTVTGTFVGSVKGAYGINCYVTENHVFGPVGITKDTADNSWNQHSYYYGDSNSPFYNVGYLPTPGDNSLAFLSPSEYTHNHVVDKMIGGAYGNSTTIPTTLVTAGQTFSKTFTYTLPAANPSGAHRFNPDNIYLIGIVQEYSSTSKANSYILNVTEKKLNSNPEDLGPLSVQNIEKTTFGYVSIYPNPTSSSANISIELTNNENVSINVYNALGQLVFTEIPGNLNAGNHSFNFNTESLNSGIYNIVISTGNSSVTKKISISK
jgi:hypothetical protein